MITQSEIARAAGVSQNTVSRVLSGDMDYRRPTFAKRADRIRKIAEKLGYRPNASAQAIRRGSFDCIALLLSADRTWSMLPDQLLAGIRQALTEHDLHLLVEAMSDDVLTSEAELPKLLRQLACDGLLINYNANIPPAMVRLIDSYKVPSIWINSKQPHDAVHPDDYGAAVRATQILLEHGHRRIAFAEFADLGNEHYSTVDRVSGFRDTLGSAGIPARCIGRGGLRDNGQLIPFLCEALRAPDRPTAILTYTAEDVPPLQLAAAVCGLQVPNDLSLITFHDRVPATMGIPVSTMILPELEQGREAVRMLMHRIASPAAPMASRPLAFAFAPGRTVAPRGSE